LAGGLPDRVASGCGTIGIRPEDIALVPPAGPHLTIDATLDAVELVGSESLLYVRGQGLDKELVLRSAGIHRGETGDTLKLHVPHTALHCFDAQTGRKMHNGVGNA